MQRILFDYYKEFVVPANGEISFDFMSDNSINKFVPFKNIFIFNKDINDIQVYVNRRDYPRLLLASAFIEISSADVSHLKYVNKSGANVNLIMTCNNDITELESLKKIARLK